jgi:hypothetical protein
VFLSHTSDQREHPPDRSFVTAAEETLVRIGHAVTDMAYFGARDAEPAKYCMDMVADADIYVGIIGMRYGSPVRGRPDLSYTELEFETATRLGLPRLIYLVGEGTSISSVVDQSPEHQRRQGEFRQRLLHEAGLTVGVTVQVGG